MEDPDRSLEKAISRLEELAKQKCFKAYDGEMLCESEWGWYVVQVGESDDEL